MERYELGYIIMGRPRLKSLELRHIFFVPIWRRVLLVVVLGFWTLVEGSTGNIVWACLMGGIGVYSVYVLFFDFVLKKEADNNKSKF